MMFFYFVCLFLKVCPLVKPTTLLLILQWMVRRLLFCHHLPRSANSCLSCLLWTRLQLWPCQTRLLHILRSSLRITAANNTSDNEGLIGTFIPKKRLHIVFCIHDQSECQWCRCPVNPKKQCSQPCEVCSIIINELWAGSLGIIVVRNLIIFGIGGNELLWYGE